MFSAQVDDAVNQFFRPRSVYHAVACRTRRGIGQNQVEGAAFREVCLDSGGKNITLEKSEAFGSLRYREVGKIHCHQGAGTGSCRVQFLELAEHPETPAAGSRAYVQYVHVLFDQFKFSVYFFQFIDASGGIPVLFCLLCPKIGLFIVVFAHRPIFPLGGMLF